MSEGKIRPVALAIFVRPRDGAVLAVRLHDQGRIFYRPPGGGIEFGEHSSEAVCREIWEDLSQRATAERLLGVVENRFVHAGGQGHEIVFNWLLRFEDESLYERDEIQIVESADEVYTAYWVRDAELVEQGTPLYPRDLAQQLAALAQA